MVKSLHVVKMQGILEVLLLEVSKVNAFLIEILVEGIRANIEVGANCLQSDGVCRDDRKGLLIIIEDKCT
jgi:hypothetical protein